MQAVYRCGLAKLRDAPRSLAQASGKQDRLMAKPPLEPPVAFTAPTDEMLTEYDQQHLVTYLRLLDAEAEGVDWMEVASLVLQIDPATDPARARASWESHLARAKWLADHGYRQLLQRNGSE